MLGFCSWLQEAQCFRMKVLGAQMLVFFLQLQGKKGAVLRAWDTGSLDSWVLSGFSLWLCQGTGT